MGKENTTAITTMSSLDDLIEKAGGCAVIDGGFATQLETHGAFINDPLWSALCLIKQPHLIKRVTFLSSLIKTPLSFFMPEMCFCFCANKDIFSPQFCRFTWNTWRLVLIFWSLHPTRFALFTVLSYLMELAF